MIRKFLILLLDLLKDPNPGGSFYNIEPYV